MTDSDTKDQNDDGKKKLRLSRPGKLQLKKTVEAGQVRQSFSHGRSKVVTVEVRKKRTINPADAERQQGAGEGDDANEGLSAGERAARAKALQEARRAEEEAKRKAEEEAQRKAEEEAQRKAEEEAERKAEEEKAQREAAEEAKAPPPAAAEPEAPSKPAAEAPAAQTPAQDKSAGKPAQRPAARSGEEEEVAERRRDKAAKPQRGREDDETAPRRPPPQPKAEPRRAPAQPKTARAGDRRASGKLTIAQALSDREERTRSLAATRRKREREKQKARQAGGDSQKILREVTIPEAITVQELANRMAERGAAVIKTLMKMGVMVTINQSIDADTAELVVAEFGHKAKRVSEADVEIGLGGGTDEEGTLMPRPPVVTVMGHVDHGKTSLLDALRATDVAAGEAGGITQHIGAYQVTLPSGAKISFIDTPGHEAFTAMRARGASVTDVVVLVVAADDGVMPQTIEAIRHARAAEAPIVVAINKIDKPGADPSRVKTELLSHELVVEEMGGDVLAVEVSAKQRQGLDKLEEAILLQAEILDLRANPHRPAEGVVVEAKMEQGRGSVATVLVQRGTLHVGDVFVAGSEWGRVRAMIDDHSNAVDHAIPATPVEVLGLQGVPAAGDELVVVEDESRAREITAFRQRREREAKAAASRRGSLEQMFDRIKTGEAKELPVVIKGDVQGSVEAIIGTLEKLTTDEVKVRVLHSAVGGINESDVTLAGASNALIIGFNVRANPQARDHAKRDGVEIRYYSIIYDVADDVKKALSGMLAPTLRENLLGYAEIREVFNISKVGKVAGCMVTEGVVKRGAKVRLLRDDVVIHEGSLSTLKRFKDEVKEVKEGYECGMSFEKYNDIQVGDQIECFEMEEVAREL